MESLPWNSYEAFCGQPRNTSSGSWRGVPLLIFLGCWWWATSGIAQQTEEQTKKINTAFSGTAIKSDQPNQTFIDSVSKRHEQLKTQVYGAWRFLYDQQMEKNPLPGVLSEGFKSDGSQLGPEGDLERPYREEYRDFIMEFFPKLLKQINVRRPKEAAEGAPAVPGPMPGPAGRGFGARRGTVGRV